MVCGVALFLFHLVPAAYIFMGSVWLDSTEPGSGSSALLTAMLVTLFGFVGMVLIIVRRRRDIKNVIYTCVATVALSILALANIQG